MRLCAPMAVEEVRHGMHDGDFLGHTHPETLRFEQTERVVKDWKRQYAATAVLPAVAWKFCIKLAQDAVAVSDVCLPRCAI